jgi:hypothetical protein
MVQFAIGISSGLEYPEEMLLLSKGMPCPVRHLLNRGAKLLLLAALLAGCRSFPRQDLAVVNVPRMSQSALAELIRIHMRTHGWLLTHQEGPVLLFEHRDIRAFEFFLDNEKKSPLVLQAEITMTPASNGLRLQASTQRVDLSQIPPRQKVVSAKIVREILEEVRANLGISQ